MNVRTFASLDFHDECNISILVTLHGFLKMLWFAVYYQILGALKMCFYTRFRLAYCLPLSRRLKRGCNPCLFLLILDHYLFVAFRICLVA